MDATLPNLKVDEAAASSNKAPDDNESSSMVLATDVTESLETETPEKEEKSQCDSDVRKQININL